MRAFVVLLAVLTVTLAKPDVSHLGGHGSGYNYNKPSDNYVGLPPLQTSSSGQQLQSSYIPPASGNPLGNGLTSRNCAHGSYQPIGTDSGNYQQTASLGSGLGNYQQTSSLGAGSGSYSTGGVSYDTGAGQQYSQPSSSGDSLLQSYQNNQASNQQYAPQSSSGQSYNSVQQLPPIVTKHFYVHAAPEEPEERAGPRYVQVGRARKNYKVIFIKAPTYGSSSQIIPVLPQNEEKTLVYVLSKKPSFNQDIQIPEPPVTEPSKPEVFFIKYKNQEEAQKAQQQIQSHFAQANGNSGSSASGDASSQYNQVGQADQYNQGSSGSNGQYSQNGQGGQDNNEQYSSGQGSSGSNGQHSQNGQGGQHNDEQYSSGQGSSGSNGQHSQNGQGGQHNDEQYSSGQGSSSSNGQYAQHGHQNNGQADQYNQGSSGSSGQHSQSGQGSQYNNDQYSNGQHSQNGASAASLSSNKYTPSSSNSLQQEYLPPHH